MRYIESFRDGIRRRAAKLFIPTPKNIIEHALEPQPKTGPGSVESYSRLIQEIERAKDPLRKGLEILFSSNGIDVLEIERRKLTFGVDMYFGHEMNER